MAPARKGIITFGLVSIPVELHVAARSTTLDFDLLHAKDHSPINYKLWCQKEDQEVSRKETVKGYKANGKYVIMDDEDFDQAEQATSRAIDVVHFVDADTVDPVYLERSYYAGPQRDTEHAYGVLLTAMRNTKTAAVVTFVMSRRQQYALLRPDADRLVLHTLYYGDEVREIEVDAKAIKAGQREVEFAEQYIKALRQPFKPEAYHDQYRETLLKIIKAKAKGETVELEAAKKPPAKVSNLMDALRQSVAAVRKPPAKVAGAGAAREEGAAGRRSHRRTPARQRQRRKVAA